MEKNYLLLLVNHCKLITLIINSMNQAQFCLDKEKYVSSCRCAFFLFQTEFNLISAPLHFIPTAPNHNIHYLKSLYILTTLQGNLTVPTANKRLATGERNNFQEEICRTRPSAGGHLPRLVRESGDKWRREVGGKEGRDYHSSVRLVVIKSTSDIM